MLKIDFVPLKSPAKEILNHSIFWEFLFSVQEINQYRGMLGNLFNYDSLSIPLVYTQVSFLTGPSGAELLVLFAEFCPSASVNELFDYPGESSTKNIFHLQTKLTV